MHENELTRRMIKNVKARGGWAHKVHGGPHQAAGEPDLDGCIDGLSLKVEVKQPGKRPTESQAAALRRWSSAGALACWVTSVDQFIELMDAVFGDGGEGHSIDRWPQWVKQQVAESFR